MNNEEIGNRIKNRRLSLNLTLKEVADIVGVANSTIQRYENGTIRQYKLPILESISKALDVNPVWLVREDAPMAIFPTTDNVIIENKSISYEESNTVTHTIKEKQFLAKYNSLDEKGKHTVHTVLDMEYNRCSESMVLAAHNDGISEDEDNRNVEKIKAKYRAVRRNGIGISKDDGNSNVENIKAKYRAVHMK